ncbi:hypothetical protein SARC_10917 [Sphaeroforma arctica JP610]|uniref:Aldehyde dehydrogenase domain-containing protein n=1 Tax=Sphaeroforma arctica JP610 TaxID=667725 RepID=A0A0L0FIJ3_9EUKA|nr:hypothetical protein SARC_10917 [Sphaeroforma arctica JP610]KNC76592.1 hypothetical protein SARC_10917 [Sphaeroforma arctica JP610]|eukprot:XP_014150494.1 hypothetical protein SARC_10917 [Sphaeroforma arctica JP610]
MISAEMTLAVVVVALALYLLKLQSDKPSFPTITVAAPPKLVPDEKTEKVDQYDITAAGPGNILAFDPATGDKLGVYTAMTPADVRDAVAKARKAQVAWAKTSFTERKRVLLALNEFVVREQETICKVAARDSGKTMVDGVFGEILTTCEKIRWTVAEGEKALKTEYRGVGWIMAHKTARVEYSPLGVVAAIVSWNYPFHNTYGPIISALFAGNAIVLKVSEHVAWSTREYFQHVIKNALRECGHSEDLVQFIVGYADAGEEVIRNVSKVTFIGSPGVGKLVMKTASETLTPVLLELGGKDAAVICDDCDYDQVLNICMRGVFQNCGQNCIGLERLVVQGGVYDKLVSDMEKNVKELTQGGVATGNFDTGAMTMQASLDKIQSYVDDAVSHGARCLVGGKPRQTEHGLFFEPTLLVDVTVDMRIAKEEVFGPIMTMMKFKDDAEAVSIVNSTGYGLGSSVFSLDYNRAEAIGAQLVTGMCNINDFGVNYLCQSLPFGGINTSGFDRFAGPEGLRGNCALRSITSDLVSGVRTSIPPPLKYPMNAGSFVFAKSLVELMYAPAWMDTLNSIKGLIAPNRYVAAVAGEVVCEGDVCERKETVSSGGNK